MIGTSRRSRRGRKFPFAWPSRSQRDDRCSPRCIRSLGTSAKVCLAHRRPNPLQRNLQCVCTPQVGMPAKRSSRPRTNVGTELPLAPQVRHASQLHLNTQMRYIAITLFMACPIASQKDQHAELAHRSGRKRGRSHCRPSRTPQLGQPGRIADPTALRSGRHLDPSAGRSLQGAWE